MNLKTLIAAALFGLLPSHLQAREADTAPFHFQKLESDYEWDEDLEKQRAVVARALPLGMSFWTALDILKQAGARCVGDRHDPQVARCVYSDWITVHDYGRADLFWTAVVRLADGKVETLSLDRVLDEK